MDTDLDTNSAKKSQVKSWRKPPALRIGKENEIDRHATWLELFYDLIFVVVITEIAHNLNQDVSPSGFFHFVMLFTSVWWSWVSSTLYSTRFDTDDPIHRFLTGIQMFCIAMLAVNIHNAWGESSGSFAFSYALIRTLNFIEYQRATHHVTVARKLTIKFAISSGIISVIWLVSALAPMPLRHSLWFLALIIDFATPLLIGQLSAQFAPHTSHLPERFGLFIIIVLGESIIGVVNGVLQQQWNVSLILPLACGVSIAFSLWWIYFDNLGGSAIESARACSRKVWAYQLWLYMHLPLAIGLTATGVGIEKIISRASSLTIPEIERWLICLAVAVCLLSLGVINFTGLIASNQRKRCKARIIYLLSSAALIIILVIAGINLSPVELIGFVSVVCAAQIILELRDAIVSS